MNDLHPAPEAPRPWWPWITAACILVPLIVAALIHWSLGQAAQTRWSAVQKRLADTHHTLDFLALVPPPVPDDQNFYAIPPLKDIALVIDDDETSGAPAERRQQLEALKINMMFTNLEGPFPSRGDGVDYGVEWKAEEWAAFFRETKTVPMPPQSGNAGSDILHALESRQPLINALNAGNKRPLSQITPPWKDRLLPPSIFDIKVPHLNPILNSLNVLALHAEATAFSGDTAQAVEDISTMLLLSDGLGQDPLLIDVLMAETGFSITIRPVWSVLKARSANASQFGRLAGDLDRVDLPSIVIKAVRGEMAACTHISKAIMPSLLAMPPFEGRFGNNTFAENLSSAERYLQLRLNPDAVILGNNAALADLMLTLVVEPLETEGLEGFRKVAKDLTTKKKIQEFVPGIFGLFSAQALPGFRGVLERALFVSVRIDQARAACAIERYFIKNSSYPEDLSKLVPEFLQAIPADSMSSQPMRYKRTGNRYQLWSVGPDGDDDGGTVKPGPLDDPERPRLLASDYPGDWVWSYERLIPEPPPPAPVPKSKRSARKAILPK